MTTSSLSLSTHAAQRDLAEIRRSAEEALNIGFVSVDPRQVQRYIDPPSNTPYGLEYAFHLLGNIQGKTVLDLGCGKGENLVPLAKRGGNVIGLDISPDLIRLAEEHVKSAGVSPDLAIGSAYQTGLPDESVDIVLCVALIHHLDIPRVRAEMLRILKTDGFVVLAEPVRFSNSYARLRNLLPAKANISEFEHPLTRPEFESMVSGFVPEDLRYFRLPFVPLIGKLVRNMHRLVYALSAWLIGEFPTLRHFATSVVVRLRKRGTV